MRKNSKSVSEEETLFDQLSFFGAAEKQSVEPDPKEQSSRPLSFSKGRLYKLEVADLLPDPSQPRQTMEETALAELSDSIRRHGILEPLLFRQSDKGELYVVAGSRRLAAAKIAGIRQIPALLTDGDAAEIALVENIVRQDLTCIEEAEAVEKLKNSHSYTLADLSSILGKSVSTISEIISLNRLPDSILNECRSDHRMARSILVEIAKLGSREEMIALFERFRNEGLSRSALRSKEGGKEKKGRKSYGRLFRSFSNKITSIDITPMSDKEKKKIKKELESLRKSIDERLYLLG